MRPSLGGPDEEGCQHSRLRTYNRRAMTLPDVPRLTMPPPGTAGGIETSELATFTNGSEPVAVTCVDYCPDQVEIQDIHDLPEFLDHHRPAWSHVRWISVDGLGRAEIIQALAEKYGLHPLAIEDIVRRHERSKVEEFAGTDDQPGRLFIVARTIDEDGGRIHSDQMSMFLGRTTLLTFQGAHRQDLAEVRQRIATPGSRLRENDVRSSTAISRSSSATRSGWATSRRRSSTTRPRRPSSRSTA